MAWDRIVGALRAIDYDGAVAIESFSQSGGEFDGLVSMWRPWFDNPDACARSGLEFLRARVAA